jgi:LCP family protein required for cell wall assembly
MAKMKRVLLVAIPIFTLACAIPTLLSAVQPTPVPVIVPDATAQILSADPNATPTATPFLPNELQLEEIVIETEPISTPLAALLPVWGDYPAPSVSPSIEIPPPVGLLPQPSGQVNVMILGSDQRPNEGGFRTDTILLLTVNPQDGTANLTSFPRDLYVYIPGWTMQRINTAQQKGGFPLLALTMEYNFGVRPDRFIMINFWGFRELIQSLGGIYVDVAVPLSDYRDRYGTYSVPAGTIYMDGETALWYVRSRYSTSDFDRTRRQQEVLISIFYRLLSLDAVQRAPELFDIYKQSVTMNLTFEDITPFLPLATQLGDTGNIDNYFVGRQHVTPWRTPGGAAVLLPNRDSVIEVMREALNSP